MGALCIVILNTSNSIVTRARPSAIIGANAGLRKVVSLEQGRRAPRSGRRFLPSLRSSESLDASACLHRSLPTPHPLQHTTHSTPRPRCTANASSRAACTCLTFSREEDRPFVLARHAARGPCWQAFDARPRRPRWTAAPS